MATIELELSEAGLMAADQCLREHFEEYDDGIPGDSYFHRTFVRKLLLCGLQGARIVISGPDAPRDHSFGDEVKKSLQEQYK